MAYSCGECRARARSEYGDVGDDKLDALIGCKNCPVSRGAVNFNSLTAENQAFLLAFHERFGSALRLRLNWWMLERLDRDEFEMLETLWEHYGLDRWLESMKSG